MDRLFFIPPAAVIGSTVETKVLNLLNSFQTAFPHHVQNEIMTAGRWDQPSPYGGPVTITKQLIEEGRQWQILDGHISFDGPVQILQGWQDPDVPWGHALRLLECLTSQDVRYHLKKSGDHRLSEEDDLARLRTWVSEICAQVDAD